VQVCPDGGGVPSCATTGNFTVGAAGATTTSTEKVPKRSLAVIPFWAVYSAPAGTVAFTRYDAVISATTKYSESNSTHDELYPGFVPLTKNATVVTSGCPSGAPVPSFGACPGGVVKYTIDYRDIMAGAGLGTEGTLASAFLTTGAGSLTLADDGTLSTSPVGTVNNWASFSKGLKEKLYPALSNNTTCGTTTNTCGDTTAGTIFTYFTGIPASGVGSTTFPAGVPATKFTVQVGGASFALYPVNFAGQTSQGTITFAVVVK
ncbi:MAG: hypothetical protein M3R35_06800, partial [Candidatus Eremiobacteraeota bacterium]|nr:hypothetical protein [Candidatus Eremiobacteraeota bacterium]